MYCHRSLRYRTLHLAPLVMLEHRKGFSLNLALLVGREAEGALHVFVKGQSSVWWAGDDFSQAAFFMVRRFFVEITWSSRQNCPLGQVPTMTLRPPRLTRWRWYAVIRNFGSEHRKPISTRLCVLEEEGGRLY